MENKPGHMAMSDKELVMRCQADSAAFEELVRRYKRAIFNYARLSTGSAQDAEEIAQDVFVKLYRSAHRFDTRYSFTTWLYKIASNTCKNKFRSRHQPALSLDDEDSPLTVASREPTPLDAYRAKIEIAEVRNAINELPTRYKEVLYLRYVEGLGYREIADILGVSMGNVEARIFRGKERVRQKLMKKFGGTGKARQAAPGEP